MYLLSQTKNNVSMLELRRLLGISYPAAWRMKHKLMQVMFEREHSTRLSGRVEVDDAYLGGELQGGKAGRGSKNKVLFIVAVQANNQNNPMYVVSPELRPSAKKKSKSGQNNRWFHQQPLSLMVAIALWSLPRSAISNNAKLLALDEKVQTWTVLLRSIPFLAL
jgi:hypothetical protein